MLRLWWCALHVSMGLAILATPAPVWLRLIAAAVLTAHCAARRPPENLEPVAFAGGAWALPARGRADQRLGPRSRVSDHWVALHLVPGGDRRILFRDQLPDAEWRRLNLELRARRNAFEEG